MNSMKVFMQYPNYIKIGHTHIFIGFESKNLEYLNTLHKDAVRKIHVFITEHESVNSSLVSLVDYFGKKSKIIIHIPIYVKELADLVKRFITKDTKSFQCFVEKYDVWFLGGGLISKYYMLVFRYTPKYLKVMPGIPQSHSWVNTLINFPKYMYGAKRNEEGIFESAEERLNPDIFKDKIISAFKTQCPNGILKTFKDDEMIWEYIMKQGEWSIDGDIS